MYQPQRPNRVDQFYGDFFHSKTFKTMMIVLACLIGIGILIICCVSMFFVLGFGGAFAGIFATLFPFFFNK